jgi:hypothetical protein
MRHRRAVILRRQCRQVWDNDTKSLPIVFKSFKSFYRNAKKAWTAQSSTLKTKMANA